MTLKNCSAKLLLGVLLLSQTVLMPTAGANEYQRYAPAELSSSQGFELGGQISHYRYVEPDFSPGFDVVDKGTKFGLTANMIQKFGKTPRVWFGKVEGRFAYGQVDYSGSGTSSGNDDYLFEGRVLIGRDSVFHYSGWSPYIGFGYRYLDNDSQGQTSTGAYGYQRESQYIYLPLGITTRFYAGRNARIATNIEYDELLYGKQISHLSDVGSGYADISNDQHSGYGMRGNIMYERQHWGFGPFVNYWHIRTSDVACAGVLCGVEPNNRTTEYGLELRYRF